METKLARRIVLATMSCFGWCRAQVEDLARGLPVQEDPGFTLAEVRQAERDRKAIRARYEELKGEGMSFAKAEDMATVEWLESLR